MKQKYNWEALKYEFFESDTNEVQEFLRRKFGEKLAKSNMKNKCKGWKKEKEEYNNKIIKKALEKRAEDEAKALEIPMVELRKAKKAVLGILIKKVSQVIKDNDEINVYEQEKILNMIKRELGEPITIAKNDTTIREQPLNEEDFIDD